MKKNLDKLLETALQHYPDVKKGYITIKHNPKAYYAQLAILFLNDLFLGVTIEIDDRFLNSNKNLQLALLIHEIGHYPIKEKDYLADEGQKYLKKGRLKRIMSSLTRKQREKNRLALDAYAQREIYADNEVIRAGYGQVFLDFTKKHYQIYKDKQIKEAARRRVVNLEEKLEIDI